MSNNIWLCPVIYIRLERISLFLTLTIKYHFKSSRGIKSSRGMRRLKKYLSPTSTSKNVSATSQFVFLWISSKILIKGKMEDTGKSLKPALKSTQWMCIAVDRIPSRYSSIFRVFEVCQWIKWLKNGPKSQENWPRFFTTLLIHSDDINTFPNDYEWACVVETSITKAIFSKLLLNLQV